MSEFSLSRTRVPAGLSVIEASAGTGKTWVLGHLLPRLIIEGRIQAIDEALIVSFTEESTRELAERVRSTINGLAGLLLKHGASRAVEGALPALLKAAAAEAGAAGPGSAGVRELLELLGGQEAGLLKQRVRNLLRAQLDCDRLMVSTIHALCRRVLSDEGFLCGIPAGFEVIPDIADLRLDALRDVWRSKLASDPVLAGLAVRQGWTLAKDLKAWRQLDPLGELHLHGRPAPLAQWLAKMEGALATARERHGDLAALGAVLDSVGGRLNGHADPFDRGAWEAPLKGLDPASPSANALEIMDWLADAGKSIPKKAPNSAELIRSIEALPLVRAAAGVGEALQALEWSWRNEALQAAQARVRDRLAKSNALSYNDLIQRLHDALCAGASGRRLAERLRARWQVALIDESQDTDPRQLAVFEAVFNRPAEMDRSLVLIGDPKQSIYGFRGADLECYVRARDRHKDRVSTLTTTHRSAPGLVLALNRLWAQPAPLGLPDLDLPEAGAARSDADLPLPDGESARLVAALVPEEARGRWRRAPDRQRNAAQAAAGAVLRTLSGAVGGTAVRPEDCAVLTRSNRQALAVREALRERGIPAVVRDDGDVLSGDEAADLALVMRAALKPGGQGYRRAALATRMLGVDAAGLLALGEGGEEDWQLRFASWGEAWRKGGVAAFLAALDQDGRLSAALASDPLGERRLTDLRHLAEVLQAEEAARRLAPERLLEWMRAAMAAAGDEGHSAPEGRLQRLEQDGSAVQVLTAHRAKGLEFEYVFCPYLWHARVPKAGEERIAKLGGRRGLASPKHLDGPERERLDRDAGWQALEEELRLAYVALTRAKRRVWLLAGWIGYADGHSVVPPSALDWILRRPSPETREAWYTRMEVQKREPNKTEREKGRALPFLCEHAARLESLAGRAPILVEQARLEPGRYGGQAPALAALREERTPSLDLGVWSITSYSALLRGQGPEHDTRDPERRPDLPQAPGADVALAGFPKGAEAGDGLHRLLEGWDFGPAPEGMVRRALEAKGMAEPDPGLADPVALVEAFLPEMAGAVVPDLGPLDRVASDAALSEWHFVLPLAESGVTGRDLAAAFAAHPEARMRDYAAGLAGLAPSALKGMLQGYIDRLARDGGRWAVLDWKSNYLGNKAAHYSQDALWACAAEAHYILQLHLYMVALRRHLRARGDQSLHGGALVFLRGLRAGGSDGLLFFPAHEAFMERLEALFLGVPA